MLSAQAEASVEDGFTIDEDEELVSVTGSLARFVRNLVAGVPFNQEQALLVFSARIPTPELIKSPARLNCSSGKLCIISPHTGEARAMNV